MWCQDASRYREKSASVSGGISSGGVTVGANRSTINGDFTNVAEQSGIVAGAGGYHVAVGGGVDLKAGVIASSADKDKNSLSADHLTYSNLDNVSNASSSGFGLSVGIGFDGKVSAPTPSVSQPAKEEDSGRALATLTPGTLTLDNQKQDLSGLNTDLSKANTTVTPYDIDRLKAKQESAAALSELLNGLTGDISEKLHFAEGSPEKTALHAAVGAIVAKLAGGDIAAGAVAGAASELANGVLQEVLKANPNLSDADSKAITQWVAVVVGAAVGGEAGAATAIDNVNHNYLDHYESLAREKAKQQLAQCQTKGGCSESDISALQKEVSYWDGIDEQRDNHLKSACDADPKGSACIAAVTDALKAIEYLRDPADPLKPSSILPGGYTDMAMRLQEDGRFGGLSNQELATAVYAERKQTIALLGNYGGSVQAALREEARNGLINSAVAVLTFSLAEKVARRSAAPVANIPDEVFYNANDIRFSQNTVSFNRTDRLTGANYTYDDLVQSMRTNGWKGDPVDVVKMPDGKLTSMDNTRIAAARDAGIGVKANVRGFDEPLTPAVQKDRGWERYGTWVKLLQGGSTTRVAAFLVPIPTVP